RGPPVRHAVPFARLASSPRPSHSHRSHPHPLSPPLPHCTPRVGFRSGGGPPRPGTGSGTRHDRGRRRACAVAATAADIICSLRGADLAGWTPPWSQHQHQHEPEPARDGVQAEGGDDARDLAWPAVARGKRSRSRRESPSASGSAASAGATTTTTTKKKKTARRGARGSPASPLDYSGASGSGSGASTSGGEDGAFCSRPEPALPPAAACQQLAAPPASQQGTVRACARAPTSHLTSPVSVSRWWVASPDGGDDPAVASATATPRPAGQRGRKKMRLPEIRDGAVAVGGERRPPQGDESVAEGLHALSQENGKLETRLHQSITLSEAISVENKGKPRPLQPEQEAPSGFVLPDLNLPADV
ncbi:hypothetical protein Zm00014a_043897, partial [Zea mays]